MNALGAFGLALGVVLLVELPDKTLVATLVLATRYRHWPVLIGVASAFAVQCVIAAVAGGLLHLLPHRWLEVAVAVLFLVGAALLLNEARTESENDNAELAQEREELPSWRIALTCFGVLFLAEWGDASQLATAALVARTGEPWAVGIGSWVALTAIATLATVAGKYIVGRIPLRLVHVIAGALFSVFALAAIVAAARG
jgi:putative Ca2+/H+ antiporter (TMEM165/GDT1 family)